ncbi:MAG: hypothetical protein CMI16_12275 [Opitutaceae bacterium]|nr:hypothetical protein [Opitutaceae bacterium]|tara:strand:- start:2154 stop:4037 length:1884 start_codon:yes stop_codon:yes gene_type:complete
MNFKISARKWPHLLWSILILAIAPVYALETAPADKNMIVSTEPMEIEVDNASGAHGQLVVDLGILSDDTGNDLVYTITAEPQHGQVGLAGIDEDADEFQTKTSRIGYFSYQPEAEYTGPDSFTYIVRNELSGLSFENKVVITVMPPAPIMLDKLEVEASHLRFFNVQGVSLTTRPNTPVSKIVPSHEDFISAEDRVDLAQSKISYMLDEQAMAEHGSAKLDRVNGQLTYSPDPGFIGVDQFGYYTVDENNPQLGVENTIVVNIEPIRIAKEITVDRSNSREVDLLFVINNSPSMAEHQQRIATNLSRFRKLFDQRDLDYRIGVLTTDFINRDRNVARDEQSFYKNVRYTQLDSDGNPLLNFWGRPKKFTKQVASNGNLVSLPDMPQPWATPETFDYVFSELVKVGTNGDSNRTAFTAVYNFVANYQNKKHAFLRPDATTIVVFFMDEEETRMAAWKKQKDGARQATWIENGKLPDLIEQYNKNHPESRQTLTGYLNYWVLRPFIIVKGNKRGKLEINAVVSPDNVSHRRAAELTGGTVLNIESDFSAPLAALGDRIANTVAVALDPVGLGASFYQKSLRVLVDGKEVEADPQNGYVYDPRNHSIRFEGEAKKKAFLAKIKITYEEHM